jgi:hypothetical protein
MLYNPLRLAALRLKKKPDRKVRKKRRRKSIRNALVRLISATAALTFSVTLNDPRVVMLSASAYVLVEGALRKWK